MQREQLVKLDVIQWLAARALPGRELAPAFDRASLPVYGVVCGIAVATAILLTKFGFSADKSFLYLYLAPLWPWATGLLVKRLGYFRIGGVSELVGLMGFMSLTVVFCTIALSAISMPFVDAELSQADRFLGFDWPSMAMAMARRPAFFKILTVAYGSVGWQPLVIVSVLFAMKKDDRARKFVVAAGIVFVLSCALFPFFTAMGPYVFYHVATGAGSPPEFGHLISSIRDSGVRHISPDMLRGLVSFPSVHAASGVLFAWAVYPVRRLRAPFIAVNVIMAISIPIVGAHYLIDLVGGIVIAVLAIFVTSRLGPMQTGQQELAVLARYGPE